MINLVMQHHKVEWGGGFGGLMQIFLVQCQIFLRIYLENLLVEEVKAHLKRKDKTRGSDLRAEMEIDLTDAYFGTTRDLNINSNISCDDL